MKELSKRQLQIISTSIHIISNGGIQDLTMKNLSKSLGISEPAIYRHFDNKQQILITMLDSFKHQNQLITIKNTPDDQTGLQHIQNSIKGIFQRLKDNPAISAVIFSEEIFQNESELAEMIQEILNANIRVFTRIILNGQRDKSIRSDVEADELSVVVMGSVRHLVTIWRISEFSFDLLKSGEKLLRTLEILIGIQK